MCGCGKGGEGVSNVIKQRWLTKVLPSNVTDVTVSAFVINYFRISILIDKLLSLHLKMLTCFMHNSIKIAHNSSTVVLGPQGQNILYKSDFLLLLTNSAAKPISYSKFQTI